MPTPTTEPRTLFTGETWAWSRDVPAYPAGAGWTLKYALANATSRVNITAAVAGSGYAVNVPAATTTGYAPGAYTWQAYVEKGPDRFMVGRGTFDVQRGLTDEAATAVELRSQAQQALDSALAALKQYTDTNGTVAEYEIAGRRMKYRSADELQRIVNYWQRRVQAEQVAELRRTGKRLAGRVLTRFGQ